MKKQFSDKELYILRNNLPIRYLIEVILAIPSKFVENVFRFLCPLCSEFYTAAVPGNNTVQCFTCKKNFNTIDITIAAKKSDFVSSVLFLKEVYEKYTKLKTNDDYQQSSIKGPTNNIIPSSKPKSIDDVMNNSSNPLITAIYTPSQIILNLKKMEKKLDILIEDIRQIKEVLDVKVC